MYKIKFKYVRYKCMRVKTNEIYSESVGPCPSYTVPAWLTVQQALTYSILNDKKVVLMIVWQLQLLTNLEQLSHPSVLKNIY